MAMTGPLRRRDAIKRVLGMSAGFVSVRALGTAATTARPIPVQRASRGGKTKVTLWIPFAGSSFRLLQAVVNGFNRQSKDIVLHMQLVSVPGAATPFEGKLQAAIEADQAPDLICTYDEAAIQLAASNVLEAVDPIMSQLNMGPAAFVAASIAGIRYKFHVWGFPIDWDPDWVLYYNRSMFEKAGVKRPPTSYEELEAMAPEFDVRKGGKIERLGFLPWIGWGFWPIAYTLLWGGLGVDNKAGQPTLNAPAVIEGMTVVYEWARRYPANELSAFTSGFATLSGGPFVQSQVAMLGIGDWQMPGIQQYAPHLDYGIVPFPVPKAHLHDFHYSTSGWIFAMLKASKNHGAVITVLNWLMQDANVQAWCRSLGWYPAKTSAQRGYGGNNPHWAEVASVFRKFPGRLYPEIWPSAQAVAMEDAMSAAADKVVLLKATPTAAFNAAQQRVLVGL